ncbi:MAG: alanyl-tRNA editing protein [Fretibacterium sp.]|nr:alanyl-tRNA editing protein [Fretibacterium sp.]
MTQKLYYEDLYRTEFDAAVLRHEEGKEGVRVILDRTLFYPGGGGQPCDKGTLGGRNVLDVFEEGEEIVHLLDGPITEGAVHGVIDWNRRFELMQQHLGQHLLAAVLFSRFELRTSRMRIEGDDVSMDFDNTPVDEETVRQAEEEANEAVWQNIPVEILYPDFEEVKLHARKLPPKTSEPIRIVKVGNIDYVPCCGLHVKNTGETGIIKVTATENHKGGTRVHLRCGRAAYRWLDVVCRGARKVQLELTCGPDGMFQRVLHLKEEIRELTSRNGELLDQAAASLAERLLRDAEPVGEFVLVPHILAGAGPDEVKRLFHALTQQRGAAALLAGADPQGISLIFGCHREDKAIDVRGAFHRALEISGARGGGSPCCTQGRGPLCETPEQTQARLQEAISAAAEVLRQSLS